MATETLTPTLATEVKEHNPANFRDNRIDPRNIYGFSEAIADINDDPGAPVSILDHPDFPNPRTTIDNDLVEEIIAAGEFLSPIVLFFNAEGQAIVIDGKTRLTAAALHLARNPESVSFRTVPYVRVRGSDNTMRLLMVKYNLDESRRPLNDIEVAHAIERFTGYGLTDEELILFFNKEVTRGGIIWLNKYRAVLEANPAVVEAFDAGRIDLVTAEKIARNISFSEQAEAAEQAAELTLEGVEGRHVRQAIGAKKASNTTLGLKPTLEWLSDFYPDYKKIIKSMHEKSRVSLEEDPTTYCDEELVLVTVENLFRFLRKESLSRRDRMLWAEAVINDDAKAILVDWLLPEDSTCNSV